MGTAVVKVQHIIDGVRSYGFSLKKLQFNTSQTPLKQWRSIKEKTDFRVGVRTVEYNYDYGGKGVTLPQG